jgi:hypothetical protein
VVAGVERLGRVGNLVGGVAAEAMDAGVRGVLTGGGVG